VIPSHQSAGRSTSAPQAAGRRFSPRDAVDFVVIGSGPAGGSVARELTRLGLNVVLLEQGPWYTRADFHHDELGVILNAKYAPPAELHPQTYRKTPNDKAERRQYLTYAMAVGGSSMHFAANYWRFRPIDFTELSLKGGVPGASLADWPITYDDLEPYYSAVEWAIGVSGRAGVDPKEPPRSRPYPMPPLPPGGPGTLLEIAAKKLGWRAIPAPMAITSQPYRGREACHNCGYCWFFPCEWGAKSGANFTMVPDAVRTGRCELRTQCKARKIETDESGRVTGVVYFDKNKKEVLQRAKAVFLCANGCESPRLLLMSKSNRFPDGLANASGVVGKHLMFNGGSAGSGEFEHVVNGHRGPPVTRIVLDTYELDPSLNLIGGGGFDFRQPFPPIISALNVPPDGPQWGSGFKSQLRHQYGRWCQAWGHTSSLPVETNQVDLDPELTDAWGLPVPRVTFKEHEHDIRLQRYFSDRGIELLTAAGATRTWGGGDPPDEPGGSVHLLGTCRMGNDPGTSVVDKYNRAHGIPNLFVVDGSSLVTCGRGQPTLTIQALAFRAAENAARMAKRGELAQTG
jgi:choline dehydrogenase-like flavoprotein